MLLHWEIIVPEEPSRECPARETIKLSLRWHQSPARVAGVGIQLRIQHFNPSAWIRTRSQAAAAGVGAQGSGLRLWRLRARPDFAQQLLVIAGLAQESSARCSQVADVLR